MKEIYNSFKTKTMETKKCYSVWVGGMEINHNYWTKEFASSIANHYKHLGYDDVIMRKEI